MSNSPEFSTPIPFIPPEPRGPIIDEVVHDYSHLPPMPPKLPVEFSEDIKHPRLRAVVAIGGALVATACLGFGINIVLPAAPPDRSEEVYCPSDTTPQEDETLATIRHKVVNMTMGVSTEQGQVLNDRIESAKDSDAIEAVMNSHLEQFNLTYHVNKLPELRLIGLPISDNLSRANLTISDIKQLRDDATRFISELSLTPRTVLTGHEQPVDIFSLQGYSDMLHSLEQGWVENMGGGRSTMVIDGDYPNKAPALLLELAGEKCGFEVGKEGFGALTKTDKTPADAWLRGQEPNIDALREYQEYMGGVAFVPFWASLDSVTTECHMTDMPEDKFTVQVGQRDGANSNLVEVWRLKESPFGESYPTYTWVYGYVSGGNIRDKKFQLSVESRTKAEYNFDLSNIEVKGFGYETKQVGSTKVMCQGFSFEINS